MRPEPEGEPDVWSWFVAWIEPKGSNFMAAFISAKTRWFRDPATGLFSAVEEARRWVEQQAAALGGVPVVWENQPVPATVSSAKPTARTALREAP
jgi:hypothetical protein